MLDQGYTALTRAAAAAQGIQLEVVQSPTRTAQAWFRLVASALGGRAQLRLGGALPSLGA